tara:strand:+ start:4776 stop:5225 length:450 start_codon:yes stop_codon:yes gene_type:complete
MPDACEGNRIINKGERRGKNMRNRGTEWKPCERVNGEVMMRVNIDPIVYDITDIIVDFYSDLMDDGCLLDLALMSKKQIKNELKRHASYRGYYYDKGIDSWTGIYSDEEHDYDMNKKRKKAIETIRKIIVKHFPEFKDSKVDLSRWGLQ